MTKETIKYRIELQNGYVTTLYDTYEQAEEESKDMEGVVDIVAILVKQN